MFTKENIQFNSGNDKCSGWIYKTNKSEKSPCIILAHGFAGTKEMRLDSFAEKFACSGYNALVFDYRHFGTSDCQPRQLLSIKKQHEDWHAAIKYAETLPYIDSTKIILWGSSFSGGHVIEIGAQSQQIAAIISQVPYINSFELALRSGIIHNFRLVLAGFRDVIHHLLSLEPYYVPVFGYPGELAAINAPGEAEVAKKLLPDGYKFDNRVSARSFLSISTYNPGNKAKKILVPWLVQVSNCDFTTPGKTAIKAAKKAANAYIIEYDYSHFEFYTGSAFNHVVEDQILFLQRYL